MWNIINSKRSGPILGIVVTTFVNSFTNSFLVICSDGLVICCGWLELMWARYSFEWFRLVFTRALIPCLTLRVLPQLTWIEEFPLVCSPILVLYPHTDLKPALLCSCWKYHYTTLNASSYTSVAVVPMLGIRHVPLPTLIRPTNLLLSMSAASSTNDKLNFASDWVN